MIRGIFSGDRGKTGSAVLSALLEDEEIEWVGRANRTRPLKDVLARRQADVVVDFTSPERALEHTHLILDHGMRPVIGTTGWTEEGIDEIRQKCEEKGLGGVIAPNFSLGATLLMRVVESLAPWLREISIVETHHRDKKDKPSGTAKETARRISELIGSSPPIASLRLPGYVARQEVHFGAVGERLSVTHETSDRSSFAPGVRMAMVAVMKLEGLVVGMEPLLQIEPP